MTKEEMLKMEILRLRSNYKELEEDFLAIDRDYKHLIDSLKDLIEKHDA